MVTLKLFIKWVLLRVIATVAAAWMLDAALDDPPFLISVATTVVVALAGSVVVCDGFIRFLEELHDAYN